jgi:hypothetical protein
MVTATAANGSVPRLRNWKLMPAGIVRHVPAANVEISSCSVSDRHISPRPKMMYQISSTVLCRTARETCPAGRRKCAMLPLLSERRTLTSEPSGASTSYVSGSVVVENVFMGYPSRRGATKLSLDSESGDASIGRVIPKVR